jgi:transposase
MKSYPDAIELDEAELESKLDQIAAVMGEDLAQPFRQLLHGYAQLLTLLREKQLSIARLRKLLFGAATETSANILPSTSASSPEAEGTSGEPSHTDEDAAADRPESSAASGGRRRPGHGRIPARRYIGCEQVAVTHESLSPGDTCPRCGDGDVYRQARWSPLVRLKGQAPVTGTVYYLERLRCHACGHVFTARPPAEAGPDKYDPTVVSVVATLRYGEGMPGNRLQRMQHMAGVPLPASVQWELVRAAADRGPRDAYEHLRTLAAQGDLVHHDDTTVQVLELTKKKKEHQPLREDDPERTGVFTTSVLSLAEDRPTIALFFTGPYHAGENLRELLTARREELPPPIQMCDALARNMPEDLRVIVANCLVHGRRYFVDVVAYFSDEVKYVVDCLKQVYQVDAEAKREQLSPDERLRLHQERSQPVMDELQRWLQAQFDEKRVEPNSSLGQAISYMLRHWEKLTLFLRVAGAPLDNNICERALKMAIRHRRNSLFYKTMRGAAIGDLYMSLIHTCYLSSVSPIDYLTALQRHHEQVRAAPADWMPWNYRQQLAATASVATAGRGPPGNDALTTSISAGNR